MPPKKVSSKKKADDAVAEAVKEASATNPKASKEEIKKEAIKQVEEAEEAKKPGKTRKFITVVIKVFVILNALFMMAVGVIGYVQLFNGSTFEYAKNNYNMMISRILTNLWYVLFGIILFSGICKIPGITFYFGFSRYLFGYSLYLIFLGFALQGPNLEGTNAEVIAATNNGTDTEKFLNKAFFWIRGIAGIVFLVLGVLGLIWSFFRKPDEDEEEEEN